MDKVYNKIADAIRDYMFQVIEFLVLLLIVVRLGHCIFDRGYNPKKFVITQPPIVDHEKDEY